MNTPDNKDNGKSRKKEIDEKRERVSREFGMQHYNKTNLPEEIENEWLDYILKFEEAHENAEQIKVYDYIGRPDFKPVTEIDEEDISEELDRILDILHENQIVLHTLCEVYDRELYRFITEELFWHEIDNIRIEGMRCNFIYEEFYPNHEYDIRQHVEFLVKNLIETKRRFEGFELAKVFKDSNGNDIDEESAKKKIRLWREQFSKLELEEFNIHTVSFDIEKESGEAVASISYYGVKKESEEMEKHRGKARFDMKYEYEYWSVYSINIPGIVI